MDLCAEMLCSQLSADHSASVRATRICPKFQRRTRLVPVIRKRNGAQNLDRLLNRFWDYPRYLRRRVGEYDCFHLCDHSYSQLVHELPAQRTGVLCHDLDTFRCLLEPRLDPRPRWFRAMVRRILAGLEKTAVVFHNSVLTRRQIEKYGLIDPAKLIHAPYGIAPEFTPESVEDVPENFPLAELGGRPFLLHVGSCIPRKRIDVLLDVFAGVKARCPDLVLVQAGGSWTQAQREQIERLGIGDALFQLPVLERKPLAALYRRAVLVLQPSEAEGFGLPVVEALACGSIVVASDIPVLREVGGEAAVYCPVADVPAWVDTVCGLIERSRAAPARPMRLAHAQRYSWPAQARTIVTAYKQLLQRA
jgi:glycosyltransferase involved in cell wall biosynthesis